MLTADQLDALTGPITDLYEQYNQSVINDISRRLVKMGKVTETAAWQMQRLIESGRVYENALKELAKTSGLSESEMRRMFEEAGVKSMRFDDSIYQAAGLNPLPLNLSPAMAQVLAAGLRKTNGLIRNLTMTTAINAQHSFIQAADLAYMQVASGAMSYDQAIRAAVQDVAEKGLSTINYATGRKEQLDVAMRRMVLTGVSQTTGNLQMARADDMGVDLVQTSAHIGARPAHQAWQGKIFSRSGTSKQYPDFALSTGYGTGAGLMGWNCRHSFYPFFEGISENAYSQAELDSYADKTVTYNGKEIPIYDATQMQRGIERKIRLWKRKEGAYEAAGFDNEAETTKVKEWQSRMRDFVKQTGLQRQSVREQVVGAGKAAKVSAASTPQVAAPVVSSTNQNKFAWLDAMYSNGSTNQMNVFQRQVVIRDYVEKNSVKIKNTQAFHGMKSPRKMLSVEYRDFTLLYEKNPKSLNALIRTIDSLEAGEVIPQTVKDKTKNIIFTMQKNKDDAYWKKIYKNFTGSLATGGDGNIVVYRGRSLDTSDAAHEMGHNLAFSVYGDAKPIIGTDFYNLASGWATGLTEGPMSQYAKNSYAEDFAESVKYYVVDRGRMKIDFPERFKVIDRLMYDTKYGG